MLVVAAPFGNYLRPRFWTPTLGTYTPHYRGGLLKRLWRCARTLRYDRKQGGWVNRLGLPNPGIERLLSRSVAGRGLSIGLAEGDTLPDWYDLLLSVGAILEQATPRFLELNCSCPNSVRTCSDTPDTDMIDAVRAAPWFDRVPVFIKLPPVGYAHLIRYGKIGFHFHACNTLPVERGGLSGPMLRNYVLSAIEDIRRKFSWAGQVQIIAGGGVHSAADVKRYLDAGANHIAVGSGWFNPRNWQREYRHFASWYPYLRD